MDCHLCKLHSSTAVFGDVKKKEKKSAANICFIDGMDTNTRWRRYQTDIFFFTKPQHCILLAKLGDGYSQYDTTAHLRRIPSTKQCTHSIVFSHIFLFLQPPVARHWEYLLDWLKPQQKLSRKYSMFLHSTNHQSHSISFINKILLCFL